MVTATEDAANLTKAIDEGAKHAAAVSFTFIGFSTYLAIVIGSIADEQFLRVSSVNLPLLNAQLPIIGFFFVAPWLLVVLHFNLLLNLYLLAGNLHRLTSTLSSSADRLERTGEQLWPFPFSHALVGRRPTTVYVCSAVVWLGAMVAPVSLLLWIEIRTLPYHSNWLSYSQFAAVLTDISLVALLWPVTVVPKGRALEWWKRALGEHFFKGMWRWLKGPTDLPVKTDRPPLQKVGYAAPLLTVIVAGPIVGALGLFELAQIPTWYPDHQARPAKFVMESAIPQCLALSGLDKLEDAASVGWARLVPARLLHLNLDELTLTQGEIKPDILARVEDPDIPPSDPALDQITGIPLKAKDLRGASLVRARLPKADLRNALLQGADLEEAKLQKANLSGAQLMGANLMSADLQGARLEGADLRGANLIGANLKEAVLDDATLDGTMSDGAQFQRANLHGAKLRCSYLRGAQLQGANLYAADLFGAALGGPSNEALGINRHSDGKTHFDGASLIQANLQATVIGGETYLKATDLYNANLECSEIAGSDFEGASLVRTRLWGAVITNSSFDLADLRGVRLAQSEVPSADTENEFLLQRCRAARTEVSGSTASDARCDERSWGLCRQADVDHGVGFDKLKTFLIAQGCKDDSVGFGIAARLINESNSTEILSECAGLGPFAFDLGRQLLATSCAASKVLPRETKSRLQSLTNTKANPARCRRLWTGP